MINILRHYLSTVITTQSRKVFYQPLILSQIFDILDCTDLEVNYDNPNYEYSGIGISKNDDKPARGYKLATSVAS